jgi:2,3-bisphosphoglycerate-independent phosphoglycerate mutase
VPLIYVGRAAEFNPDGGTLSDIAPTMLYLMGLDIPEEMTGQPLLKLHDEPAKAAIAK